MSGNLLLTRKPQEGITITVPPSTEPTQVHMKYQRAHGSQVRLLFQADEKVTIVRDELIHRDSEKGAA